MCARVHPRYVPGFICQAANLRPQRRSRPPPAPAPVCVCVCVPPAFGCNGRPMRRERCNAVPGYFVALTRRTRDTAGGARAAGLCVCVCMRNRHINRVVSQPASRANQSGQSQPALCYMSACARARLDGIGNFTTLKMLHSNDVVHSRSNWCAYATPTGVFMRTADGPAPRSTLSRQMRNVRRYGGNVQSDPRGWQPEESPAQCTSLIAYAAAAAAAAVYVVPCTVARCVLIYVYSDGSASALCTA